MLSNELKSARKAIEEHLSRRINQRDMASSCGLSYRTYQRLESGEDTSLRNMLAFIQGIRKLVPELGTIEIQETQKVGFAEWLRRELRRIKTGEVNVSPSERSLDDLLADAGAREVLGLSHAMSEHMRKKLKNYRADLDRDDWIAVVRMVQAGREGEDEWKFTDPSVIGARMYFKSTRVLTDAELRKVEGIVQSVLDQAQQEEKSARGTNNKD